MFGHQITMAIDGVGVLQALARFQQPDRHHAQVSLHYFITLPRASRVTCSNWYTERCSSATKSNQATSDNVKVSLKAGCGAVDWYGVVAVEVERRVQVDEIKRRGVEVAQHVQAASSPDRSFSEVSHHTHAWPAIVLIL